MPERCIVNEDVFLGDALVQKVLFKDIVGGSGIDIVCAEQSKFLDAQFLQEIIGRRDRLLIRGRARIEHVARAFLALILNRVEHQAVQLFQNRQCGFARNRCPGAEDDIHLRHGQKLARLFGEQRPVRGGIHDNGFDFAIQQTARSVLLRDQKLHRVFQRRLGNGHRAGQRVQHANLDRVLAFRAGG